MSIGLIEAEPSEMPDSGARPGVSFGMPMSMAVSMIFFGPRSMATVRSTYAVLIDSSVALSRLTAEP